MDCENRLWKKLGDGRGGTRLAAAACLLGVGVLMVAVNPAAGQPRPGPSDAFLMQQRALEEDVRAALDKELPADQKIDFDWGGWYSFYLFTYDDGIKSSRTLRQYDLRLWGSASIDQGAHEFYSRMKLLFYDFNHGDGYYCDEDDTVGPNLDRAYYQFDLRQAARAYWHEDIKGDFKVKVGRDLVQFGTGYALSLPMDHVLLTAEVPNVRATALMGTSIRSLPDIDRTQPSYGQMDRNFWGGQIELTTFQKHVPFVYAFWNQDWKSEHPWVPLQNFDYDSWYIGAGSRGELPIRNLMYSTEWVWEGGRSYGDRQFLHRDDINAWAFDMMLDYLSQRPMKPRVSAEYMFASGDGNRYGSPTDAIGGNTRGPDTSFSGFGYRNTGLCFAPWLSNVHIWRLGGSIKPLEKIERLRNLEVGTDWFLYAKNQRNGAVSDPTADQHSTYLGWEMDYFINWRITSDLAWTTRFGTFFPGDSFSDETTRTFFLTGVTYSF
jgi:hypothetical protein